MHRARCLCVEVQNPYLSIYPLYILFSCRAGLVDADVELLQLELRATREEAASAKGHTKQFQELATNAERTIKDMEVSHEICGIVNRDN